MKITISTVLATSVFVGSVLGQQVGTQLAETHPSLSVQTCTKSGGCTSQTLSIVLDSNWRWTHETNSTTNCYTGNTWNTAICPDDVTCASNCALDGADYTGTYGITSSGNSLKIGFVTNNSNGKNVGARTYLLASNTQYQLFKLLNQEFTFDVDVSQLPCGLNGALYFSWMDADGGTSKYPTNKCGAQYGTGYCDSQCPRDLKWINGQANAAGWVADSNSANTGKGNYGSCCEELDIWEANSMDTQLTPHTCSVTGQYRCTGTTCGIQPANRYGGVCDPDGCDFNPYRLGATGFYGSGKTVDTSKVFTVVTQFITSSGSSSGSLSEIRRFYVQNGNVIANPHSTLSTLTSYNSITDAFCNAKDSLFGDKSTFEAKGGLAGMGNALSSGMVLVLSLWDDYAVDMLWLDSTYPTNASSSTPGAVRGPCPTSSGVPATVEAQSPNAYVTYSNIKWGDINSTFSAGSGGSTTTGGSGGGTTTTTTSNGGACSSHWGQCAGMTYTGPTTCCAPYTCHYSNPWYSQCL